MKPSSKNSKVNLKWLLQGKKRAQTLFLSFLRKEKNMAKVKFLIKNEKGQDVQKTSKEITTKDYRDYLILNEALSSDVSEVEKLDKQLEFIASLFEDLEVEELLKYTDMANIFAVFADIYSHLVGDVDPKVKS
nr:MAG TPA: hypothetical protein [Caudoviricetes sp.]